MSIREAEGASPPMRPIKGGTFAMGSADFYPDERPVRQVSVEDFSIDETPVTNADFAAFVRDTGHVTVAETAPDPADYPGMPPEMARAGSIVFTPPLRPVPLDRPIWWRFVFGACWNAPEGPGSSIRGREDHPVVHIAYADASAYALWAGKALPREAEWEYAARGGLEGKTYPWGDSFEVDGRPMAKIWRGNFPHENLAPEGLKRTSPVRAYPPNGYGLYDVVGNVWEWTSDPYAAGGATDASGCCGTEPAAPFPQHVTKGGSHLCAPSYCHRYRPAARWPQTIDTSTSHLGFRCVRREAAAG